MTDPDEEYPELAQFFGGYFHQDWPDDYPPGAGVPGVLEAFAEESPGWVPDIVSELDRLLAADYTEEELERTVQQLSTDYYFNDPTCRAGMTAMRDQLRAYLDTHPDDEATP